MLFREERLEMFAQQAETMIQSDGTGWARVDDIGAALGMTPHESRFLAAHLEREGWVRLEGMAESHVAQMSMTLKGFREIAKLRQPRIVRWLDKHPGIMGAIAGALASGVIELIKLWLFGK